ncbi:hypothetical protein NAEGRDRAFT_57813 [Naegleria gruberi]|uniref:Uncharacterized protein n=1 Tax=Naegleria gruberi TaxID=5762 RepID=D2VCQ5_NAEGR|nr:uncharacterized protein NAEGRDRAFT_57813 [Naegleria gruberi]EFC45349.1 hypothetical protein NAEGRDRAFT_57813 [Naegleria gruberi]|eukprot:XP_002678093.1 hypothetical protein NAEGRDRAFT_57813 [Naegleria gruberi strain NEG-M]
MGQNSACEQDRDFAQGQIFTRFDKYHQREQEQKRAFGQLRQVSSTNGLESASALSKKQRKSIHGTRSISNPSSPGGSQSYSSSFGSSTEYQHHHPVNISITHTNNNNLGEVFNSLPNIVGGGDSPNSLSPATPQSASTASSRRRGHSSASPQSNYFVNNNQTQLMINQDVIEVKKRNDQDSDDEEEDPAIQRRSRRKSLSLFKNAKKVDMF